MIETRPAIARSPITNRWGEVPLRQVPHEELIVYRGSVGYAYSQHPQLTSVGGRLIASRSDGRRNRMPVPPARPDLTTSAPDPSPDAQGLARQLDLALGELPLAAVPAVHRADDIPYRVGTDLVDHPVDRGQQLDAER